MSESLRTHPPPYHRELLCGNPQSLLDQPQLRGRGPALSLLSIRRNPHFIAMCVLLARRLTGRTMSPPNREDRGAWFASALAPDDCEHALRGPRVMVT